MSPSNKVKVPLPGIRQGSAVGRELLSLSHLGLKVEGYSDGSPTPSDTSQEQRPNRCSQPGHAEYAGVGKLQHRG